MAVRNKHPKTIIISPLAQADIIEILNYLTRTWDEKVAYEFLQKLNTFYYLVSINLRPFWILQQTKEYSKICDQQAEHNLL